MQPIPLANCYGNMKHTIYILLLLAASCTKNTCKNSVAAELKDLTGLDGCGKVLALPDGNYLEPQNLSEFPGFVDGDKVWVNYHTAENGFSVCMVGEIVLIDCMVDR
jgi:hypothetical protein